MATKQEIRDYFARFGRKGGKLSNSRMTAEQRREKMRKAAEARWARFKREHDANTAQIDANITKIEARTKKAQARKRKAEK